MTFEWHHEAGGEKARGSPLHLGHVKVSITGYELLFVWSVLKPLMIVVVLNENLGSSRSPRPLERIQS